MGPRIPHTNPNPKDGEVRTCGSDGPLFFFRPDSALEALALSPISHFTSNAVASADESWSGLGVDASKGCGNSKHCTLFETRSVLLARPGITRVTRAFGSVLRQAQNTSRRRGPGVGQLSCKPPPIRTWSRLSRIRFTRGSLAPRRTAHMRAHDAPTRHH